LVLHFKVNSSLVIGKIIGKNTPFNFSTIQLNCSKRYGMVS